MFFTKLTLNLLTYLSNGNKVHIRDSNPVKIVIRVKDGSFTTCKHYG